MRPIAGRAPCWALGNMLTSPISGFRRPALARPLEKPPPDPAPPDPTTPGSALDEQLVGAVWGLAAGEVATKATSSRSHRRWRWTMAG